MRPLLLSLLTLLLAVPAGAQEGVRAAAEEALAERFPSEAVRMEVRVLRTGGLDGDALDGARVVPSPEPGLPRGRTQVRVETPDGRTGWALLHVAHYDSVVVARTRVPRGEGVAARDLAVAWMETTRFHGEPLRAADLRALRAEGPLTAERPLREGRALRRDDLRPPYAVETGGAVEMTYRRAGLVFRIATRAREPGRPGDTVRLYAHDTDTMYRARLDAPGRATWIETL